MMKKNVFLPISCFLSCFLLPACDASNAVAPQKSPSKTLPAAQNTSAALKSKANTFKVGDRLEPVAPVAPSQYQQTKWSELMPKGFDPGAALKSINLSGMQDSDPRAAQLLQKLKDDLNNAPVNKEILGKAIKIPGFTIPLDFSNGKAKEFLLVPYFGACIHTPPPPANQILLIKSKEGLKADEMQMMDAVWVSGIIKEAKSDTEFGKSNYEVTAFKVEPYRPKTN